VDQATATSAHPIRLRPDVPYRTFGALVSAGFRRYSTYRQATVAGISTNVVFGFLNCYVVLAVAAGNDGTAAGYGAGQLATYVWINQGMLATVGAWGDTELAERIRSGDVVSELMRPIHPVLTYLCNDLGRAGELVARLAALAPLRDLSVVEPDIEDVVARPVRRAEGQECSMTSTAQVSGSSAS